MHGREARPARYALEQNVPNPFRDATVIGYALPEASEARLEIFDAQGRLVRRFTERAAAGRHTLAWDLRDRSGRRVAPGLYAYRLRAGSFEARRKLVVMP